MSTQTPSMGPSSSTGHEIRSEPIVRLGPPPAGLVQKIQQKKADENESRFSAWLKNGSDSHIVFMPPDLPFDPNEKYETSTEWIQRLLSKYGALLTPPQSRDTHAPSTTDKQENDIEQAYSDTAREEAGNEEDIPAPLPALPRSQIRGRRRWTEDEHERCMVAVAEFGPRAYRKIADRLRSRTSEQVRSHLAKHYKLHGREAAEAAHAATTALTSLADGQAPTGQRQNISTDDHFAQIRSRTASPRPATNLTSTNTTILSENNLHLTGQQQSTYIPLVSSMSTSSPTSSGPHEYQRGSE